MHLRPRGFVKFCLQNTKLDFICRSIQVEIESMPFQLGHIYLSLTYFDPSEVSWKARQNYKEISKQNGELEFPHVGKIEDQNS